VTSPFRLLAGELPIGSLVIYEINSVPTLGRVLKQKDGKCTILNERGEELLLPISRLTSFKAPQKVFRFEAATDSDTKISSKIAKQSIAETLKKIGEKVTEHASQINLPELWSLVSEEPNNYTIHQLAELLPTQDSDHFTNLASELGIDAEDITCLPTIALHLAIIKDRIYFRRQDRHFIPRSETAVEELKKAEEALKQRQDKEDALFATLVALTTNEDKAFLEEIRASLQVKNLMRMAAQIEDPDPSRRKETKLFLERLEKVLQDKNPIFGSEIERTDSFRARLVLAKLGLISIDENLFYLKSNVEVPFSSTVEVWIPNIIERTQASVRNATRPITDLTGDSGVSHSLLGEIDITLISGRIALSTPSIVTIDDPTTNDRDDGLSLELLNSSAHTYLWRLGVHISDVASSIGSVGSSQSNNDSSDPLESLASERLTSVYCSDITRHMLPKDLVEKAFSLDEGTKRPALSLFITYNEDVATGECSIENVSFAQTAVSIQKNWGYDEVDQIIENFSPALALISLTPALSLIETESSTEIKASETPSEADHNLSSLQYFSALHRFAKWFETHRSKSGAQEFDNRDISVVYCEKTDSLILTETTMSSPSRLTIRELMICYNWLVAEAASRTNTSIPFRTQSPPQSSANDSFEIPLSSGPARDYLAKGRLNRSLWGTEAKPHFSLGLPCYCQATSPIRRYYDLLAQQQIRSLLNQESPPYSKDRIAEKLEQSAPYLIATQLVAKDSKRFWMLRYLAQEKTRNNSVFEGVVVRADNRGILALIPSIQLTCLVKNVSSLKLGDSVKVKLVKIDPYNDFIKWQLVV
jgi:exoribonuclease R